MGATEWPRSDRNITSDSEIVNSRLPNETKWLDFLDESNRGRAIERKESSSEEIDCWFITSTDNCSHHPPLLEVPDMHSHNAVQTFGTVLKFNQLVGLVVYKNGSITSHLT